jgi:hypothetical protein
VIHIVAITTDNGNARRRETLENNFLDAEIYRDDVLIELIAKFTEFDDAEATVRRARASLDQIDFNHGTHRGEQ